MLRRHVSAGQIRVQRHLWKATSLNPAWGLWSSGVGPMPESWYLRTMICKLFV